MKGLDAPGKVKVHRKDQKTLTKNSCCRRQDSWANAGLLRAGITKLSFIRHCGPREDSFFVVAVWVYSNCWTKICKRYILHLKQWWLQRSKLTYHRCRQMRICRRLFGGMRHIWKQWLWYSRPWDFCWNVCPSGDQLTIHVEHSVFSWVDMKLQRNLWLW